MNISALTSNHKDLEDWIKNNNSGFTNKDLLIDDSISLSFTRFEDFYKARRQALKQRFVERVYIQDDQQEIKSVDLGRDNFDDLEVDDDDLLIA